MIENLMILALGVLGASLVWLALLGAVWRRAVRLTTQRLHGSVPVSMVDIKADKDHLRAEFAVAVRKQEMANEALRASVNDHTIALATCNETIRDLNETLALRQQTIDGLNGDIAREQALAAELTQQLETATRAWHDYEEELAQARGEIASLQRLLNEREATIDTLRIENIAHMTQIDNLRLTNEQGEKALSVLRGDHEALKKLHAENVAALTSERQALHPLQQQLHAVKTSLAEREASLQESNAALSDLSQAHERLTDTARQGGEQIIALERALEESRQAREALSAAHETHRREADDRERALNERIETLQSGKTLAEGALAKAREDREALHQELIEARKTALPSPDEGIDAAVLREKIADIAAKLAALTAAREGEGSPIDAILARTPPGTPPALADRIRTQRAGPA